MRAARSVGRAARSDGDLAELRARHVVGVGRHHERQQIDVISNGRHRGSEEFPPKDAVALAVRLAPSIAITMSLSPLAPVASCHPPCQCPFATCASRCASATDMASLPVACGPPIFTRLPDVDVPPPFAGGGAEVVTVPALDAPLAGVVPVLTVIGDVDATCRRMR